MNKVNVKKFSSSSQSWIGTKEGYKPVTEDMHWITTLDAELVARTPTWWYKKFVLIPKVVSELEEARERVKGRVSFLSEHWVTAENDKDVRPAMENENINDTQRCNQSQKMSFIGSRHECVAFKRLFVMDTKHKGGKTYPHCEVSNLKHEIETFSCRHSKEPLT